MNERTDSFASTTAIRHGHAGEPKQSHSSPLATAPPVVAASEEASTPATETPAPAPVAEADTTSPLPVAAAPTTVADVEKPSPATPAKAKTTESAIADSPVNKSSPSTTKPHTTSAASPISKTSAADDSHRRTSSNGSNGKKKAGFMAKLKGEMKVISGKIGGDEAKVQAGERLKHGGKYKV